MSTGKYWSDGPLGQINPVAGCTQVSEACANCYARELHGRFNANTVYGINMPKGIPRFYEHPFNMVTLRPEQLKKFDQLAHKKESQVVFVGNMCDLFHEAVPYSYIGKVFEKIIKTRHHTFLILTKRPERMLEYMKDCRFRIDMESNRIGGDIDFRDVFEHVWFGVTAENQARAYERIPLLVETPAAHRWVSVEPMLGPICLGHAAGCALDDCPTPCEPCSPLWGDMLNLVIAGGESSLNGHVRTMNPEWARSIKEQCIRAGTKFYFKQYGTGYCRENHMAENQVFDGTDYSTISPLVLWRRA